MAVVVFGARRIRAWLIVCMVGIPPRLTEVGRTAKSLDMPIRVTCQGCAAQYAVGEQFAGKRVKCKRCGAMFEIPAVGGPTPTHIEDMIARNAPAVSLKDDEDRIFKEPPPKVASGVSGVAIEPERYDELDVAASTRPEKKEENGPSAVGRPDADATPTGKKRLLKLKPGARSFSDKAKIGEIAAARQMQREKEELQARIEMRTVFSDFRKNPLSKLVMGIGLGAFVLYHLWMALNYHDWLVLRNMGIRLAAYVLLVIPLGMAGALLAAFACRFKPTRPLVFIVGVTAAAPPGVLAMGFLTEDNTWRIVSAVAALPITFWVFHLAFQQGILRNLAAFLGVLTLPLLVAWAATSYVQGDEGLRSAVAEYLSEVPASREARALEKARRDQKPADATAEPARNPGE